MSEIKIDIENINKCKAVMQRQLKEIETLNRDYSAASYQYECLKKLVLDYQSTLDDNHEIAVTLASFGDNVTMLVDDIHYIDPVLIVFKGMVGDNYSALIQHISQLNILLTTVAKPDPEKPPRRIGFDIGG